MFEMVKKKLNQTDNTKNWIKFILTKASSMIWGSCDVSGQEVADS